MPTAEQIRQFLVGTILPPLAGVVTTWIVANVHVLNLFHITEASIAGELTQLGTFAVSAAIAWLTTHHILKGHYTPAEKAAVEGELPR
jgi:hypothetical protein